MQGNIALSGQGCYVLKPPLRNGTLAFVNTFPSLVTYYRVSTERQGQSGLGLDAQCSVVAACTTDKALLGEVMEIESGRRDNRPPLAAVLTLCRQHKACLVIAKLDRLARSVTFTSNLVESGVGFVAVGTSQAARLTPHILAAVAEYERDIISQRTRVASVAAKARATRLGDPRPDRRRSAPRRRPELSVFGLLSCPCSGL